MLIDINDIDEAAVQFDNDLELEAAPSAGLISVGAARIRGVARRDPRGAVLTARLTTSVELSCSRCVEPCKRDLDISFELLLVLQEEQPGPGDHQLRPEDAALYHAAGGRARLEAIANEQLFLHLPLKPICEPGCRGLCPTCGANRNRLKCGCQSGDLDPRLAPLADLKRRMGGR